MLHISAGCQQNWKLSIGSKTSVNIMYMVEISIMLHHFHFWDSSPILVKEMLIFNFWGRMSAQIFFLLQFFISLGKPKFDIISFFLGHLILGESRFYSQWQIDKRVPIPKEQVVPLVEDEKKDYKKKLQRLSSSICLFN